MADDARPGPDAALPPTARSLPIALLRAREKVMGPIRVMLADAGVTEQQWRVLRVLDESGPMAQAAIAEAACLRAPSLTRIVQALAEKGMVERGADPDDRRRQTVALAPAGRALIGANIRESRRITRAIAERLGAEKHDRLIDLLEDLNGVDI